MSGLITLPDLITPVVGFRSWSSAGDGFLHSRGGGWLPGPNEAICDQHATHNPPVEDCSCGLYAYHGLDRFDTNGTYGDVFGTVIAWGDMCVARDGFRAQYGQVVMIASPVGGKDHLAELDRIAENYGCEHVQLHDLEARAHEFGEPIPDEMRPGRQPARPGQLPQPLPPPGTTLPPPGTTAGSSSVIYPGPTVMGSPMRKRTVRHPGPSTRSAPPMGLTPATLVTVYEDTPTMRIIDGTPCIEDTRSPGVGLGLLALAGIFGMPGVAQLIDGQSSGIVPTIVGGVCAVGSWLALR